MVRKVHEEELRERQNMRDNAKHRKDGDWCVVGVCDDWVPKYGLQGWGYESKSEAEDVASSLDNEDEFQHVNEHRVMKLSEFEELCDEENIDRRFPWKK